MTAHAMRIANRRHDIGCPFGKTLGRDAPNLFTFLCV